MYFEFLIVEVILKETVIKRDRIDTTELEVRIT